MGIISGCPLPEVNAMVGIKGIYYAGNHRLGIEEPALKLINPVAEVAKAEMKDLAQQLSAKLGDIEGAIVENKGLSLSIHYRLVKKSEENQVRKILHQITAPLLNEGKIRLTSGEKVWVIRPPIDWHKGKAVETIRSKMKAVAKRLTFNLHQN